MKKYLLLLPAIALCVSVIFAQSGNIGIGTNTPNSRLQINGSLALGYRTVTASTTLSGDDYGLEFTGSAAATINLPNDTICKGRIYSIKNNGTGSPAPIVTITPFSGQTIDGKTSWRLSRAGEVLTLISNGTNWNVQIQEASVRSNYVLVKSASDLPAPVSGVITLTAGTLYEINGTIITSNKINLNDCSVVGKDRNNDIIVYSAASGELFTGSNGGSLMNLTLIASVAGTKVFNLDAGGAAKSLLLQLVYIFNSNNVGLIKGFSGFVVFQSVAFSGNLNGIVFQDINELQDINSFWIQDNHNTYRTLVGSFANITINGGEGFALAAYSAKVLDITGITAITGAGQIKNSTFLGDGSYVFGNFSSKWAVESAGVPTEKDDVATGDMYVSATAQTTFTALNTPTKALGTTTATDLFRVSSPANNRLAYTGAKTKSFMAVASVSLTSASSNKVFSFYIAKNGVILPESKMSRKIAASGDIGGMSLTCLISMASNDYLEIWAENNTDGSSMTVQNMTLSIK